jgi:hypothetical protein
VSHTNTIIKAKVYMHMYVHERMYGKHVRKEACLGGGGGERERVRDCARERERDRETNKERESERKKFSSVLDSVGPVCVCINALCTSLRDTQQQ